METLVLEAACGARHMPGRVFMSWAGQQLVSASKEAVTPSMWMSLPQFGDTAVGRNPTSEGLEFQLLRVDVNSKSAWIS